MTADRFKYSNYSGTEGQKGTVAQRKESWPRRLGFGYPQRGFVLHEKDEPWSPLAPPKAGKHRTSNMDIAQARRAGRSFL